MFITRIFFRIILALVTGISTASAEEYRSVITFPVGSQTDLIAKAMSESFLQQTGHRLILENIPGAETVIGTVRWRDQKSPIIFTSSGQIITNQILKSDLPYNDSDFNHVIYIGSTPAVWIVNSQSPINDLRALSTSKNLTVGGYASSYNENFYSVKRKFNLSATLIDYKGAPQVITDVAGGHIESGLVPITPMLITFVEQEKIRILGSSFSKSLKIGNYTIPSISQTLGADTFSGFVGIALHPSLDAAQSEFLRKALWQSLQSDNVQQLLKTLYFLPDSSNDKVAIMAHYQSLRNLVKNNQSTNK